MNKTKCVCVKCNKEFQVYNCFIKRDGKRLYCSRKCYDVKKEKNTRYKKDEGWLNCIYCNDLFKVKPSAILSKKNRTYCTKECKEKNIDFYKIEKKCKECNNVFKSYIKHDSKFCSRSCISRNIYRVNGQMNKGVQRGKGGKRADLDNIYLRSSWEANYARYLNFLIENKQILKWEYEVDTFEFFEIKKGTRFYTPDFKVYLNNGNIEYHEVKGWMDQKSITRANRMKLYYPNVKIILVDKVWFRSNSKTLSKIVKNWEIKCY